MLVLLVVLVVVVVIVVVLPLLLPGGGDCCCGGDMDAGAVPPAALLLLLAAAADDVRMLEVNCERMLSLRCSCCCWRWDMPAVVLLGAGSRSIQLTRVLRCELVLGEGLLCSVLCPAPCDPNRLLLWGRKGEEGGVETWVCRCKEGGGRGGRGRSKSPLVFSRSDNRERKTGRPRIAAGGAAGG